MYNGGREKMIQSKEIWRKALILAIAGGAAFWAANLAISLTPIAAEYRAALSISYFPMLLEALAGGLIIGFCISYLLLRYFDKIPTVSPIFKSVILTFAVLCIIEAFSIFVNLNNASVYLFLLIGAGMNVPRFLALGIVIGYIYKR
jgi:NhaP-type Na+/H+ and K+/H+ antiporter